MEAVLDAEGRAVELEILRTAVPDIVETGHDNWNNGVTIYTVYLQLPPRELAPHLRNHEEIEATFYELSRPLLRRYQDAAVRFELAPLARPKPPSENGYTLGKNHLGGGGYADVWEGKDRFGRPRAIKIIRKSMGSATFVENQARALARVEHPNVIKVHDLIDIIDPSSGEASLGIVMDKAEGPKLSVELAGGVTPSDALRIGLAVIDGVRAIHSANMFHGDLHNENVIVGTANVVIIDILFTKSASAMSTKSKDARLATDIQDVWRILQALLSAAGVAARKQQEFDKLRTAPRLDDLRLPFANSLNAESTGPSAADVDVAKRKFTDAGFVKGPEYAAAVAATIPQSVMPDVLIGLLRDNTIKTVHGELLRLVFAKLDTNGQNRVVDVLAKTLDAEVPSGQWPSPIIFLASTASDSWDLLPPHTRIRLEHALADDIAKGTLDTNNPLQRSSGSLGTWVNRLWRRMSNIDAVCDALVDRLKSNWYGQNYVAAHFFGILPLVAGKVGKEDQVLAGLRSAIANDAKVVKSKLDQLPSGWQEKLAEE